MKKIRCAIYTRKSSEEGLDQEFNSLHAQREACAAYIASQKHEGWVALPEHYDDGGISGGTLERAGLKKLLQHVDEGLVDQIVVYKIDRLTRSLADFAKLVDRLDAADASFVSVTQSFNTATSMGRLTLNVLLSFAQFEREVTAERIRDKIAASKKKGLWMGGAIPLGYEPDGRTLKIVPGEAETVRTLYDLYLQHRSILAVVDHANRLGLRGKVKLRKQKKANMWPDENGSDATTPSTDPHAYSVPFERAALHYLLTNPVYAGRIRHKGIIHEGQHPPIVDQNVWNKVQEHLQEGAARKRGQGKDGVIISPLASKLVDEVGDMLTPSQANKKGKRYRYYVSNRLLNTAGKDDSNRKTGGWRLPAKALEDQIANAILSHLLNRLPVDLLINPAADIISKIGSNLDLLDVLSRTKSPIAILPCIERGTIRPGAIEISLGPETLADTLEISEDELNPGALMFTLPFQFRKRGVETKLTIGTDHAKPIDTTLISSIAKAHQYYDAIKNGQTFEDIAESENLSKRRIMQVIDLAFLAPDIVKLIVQGDQPLGLTAKWLGINPMPSDWQAQRRIVATL
ncbi:Site-specific recombinase, DNA invertase (Pin)-like protein [Hoeflea phototrophica DFL-43]|jgi:DNA invertase Pin-like site-specific DNA recombinase|uniref:Site-specific recombinase, DNA invertase (Pin)-like protein n=1 Tax=Hoeflea phototrophica (strain DSM 17068 / NCIMB 14078 / DFL-43) TaxID=411684 RepID=A9D065_HOEPD|nr:recombinase family protein [Hoeflea phototrophica]EDQ34936.1 Site-specific recombinase, DNA invertase (Pin)-like protein [Hoeflea phototrophica DFL-43]